MRIVIGATILAAGLVLAGDPGAVAASVGANVRGVALPESAAEQVQYWDGRYCERLRRACVYKEERGEVGEGNCRRYREECGGSTRYDDDYYTRRYDRSDRYYRFYDYPHRRAQQRRVDRNLCGRYAYWDGNACQPGRRP